MVDDYHLVKLPTNKSGCYIRVPLLGETFIAVKPENRVCMSLQIQLWIPLGRNVVDIFPYNSRSRNRLVGKSVSIFNGKCTGRASGNESRSISGYPLLVGKGWTQFKAVYPGIIGSAALPSSAKSFWRFKYHLKKKNRNNPIHQCFLSSQCKTTQNLSIDYEVFKSTYLNQGKVWHSWWVTNSEGKKNSFHSKKESSAGPPPVVMGNFVRYYFSDSTFWNQWTNLVPFISVNDISDPPIFQILIWNLVFGYLVDWKLGGLANQVEMEISSCFYQNPNVHPGICNLLNILNICHFEAKDILKIWVLSKIGVPYIYIYVYI